MYVFRGVNDLGKDSYRLLIVSQLGVGVFETRIGLLTVSK